MAPATSSMVVISDTAVREREMTSPWTVDNVSQSANSVPESCIILGINTTIPWDNPNNLISHEAHLFFYRIKAGIIIPVLFFIGFPANCINMAVFFKQGLKERINLCLFSLALVDLLSLTGVLAFHADQLFSFTEGERNSAVARFVVNNNLIGLYGIAYGSTFLSVIISTERCICVLFPLKAQRCIPTKAIAFIIIVGVSVLVFARFAVTAMYQVTCFYEMRTQRLSWQLYVNSYYFRNQAILNALDGVFYGFCLTVGFPIIVLITTIITSVRLTHIVRWRSQTSSSWSSKEIGVTKMLIALSIEFFVLSIPIIVLRVVPVFEPRLRGGGEFANSFYVLTTLSEICSYVSSSVNLFVYYFTGTKFKQTLQGLLHWKTSAKVIRKRQSSSTVTVIE